MAGKIELGMTVKDLITNFEGVLIGVVMYISGCNQGLVSPLIDKDGKRRESEWFDVQRLQQVGTTVIVLDNSTTPGCDIAAPKR